MVGAGWPWFCFGDGRGLGPTGRRCYAHSPEPCPTSFRNPRQGSCAHSWSKERRQKGDTAAPLAQQRSTLSSLASSPQALDMPVSAVSS